MTNRLLWWPRVGALLIGPVFLITLLSGQARAEVAAAYGKLPRSFERNEGQADSQVRFLSRSENGTLFLTPREAVLVLQRATVRMKLLGGGANPRIDGLDVMPGVSNYLVGDDPTQWRTGIRNYTRVRYQEVYPGVDLVFYANAQQLEFDFVVAPGADPSVIDLGLEGAKRLTLDKSGDLVLQLANDAGPLRLHRPIAYQAVKGGRKEVKANYVPRAKGSIGFQIDGYDSSSPLVIDPTVVYQMQLGSSNALANSLALDQSGNAYVAGRTDSRAFPGANMAQQTLDYADGFVAKLNASGTALVYATYLGGRGQDTATSIAVDSTGSAYVAGYTSSPDFPVTSGAIQQKYTPAVGCTDAVCSDAFIAKLTPAGDALVYSTFLGGTGTDIAWAVAADQVGNAYVTGETSSTDFPTTHAFQAKCGPPQFSSCDNAFVAKINPTGTALVYSTYLGGGGGDAGYGIALDSSGSAYIVGTTYSGNFPTKNPIQPSKRGAANCFVTKLSASGDTLVYSTYLGGSARDSGYAVALDSLNNVVVTGVTTSVDFLTVNPLQPNAAGTYNAFLAKINASGNALLFSTYLGGAGPDEGYAVAVGGSGDIYVAGTAGPGFPQKNSLGGSGHGFVARVAGDGSAVVFSTYFGYDNRGLAVDAAGNAYVAGPGSVFAVTGTSGAAFVAEITANNPVPQISSISPAHALFNSTGFSLTVSGTGFVPASVVRWNGSDRITGYVSASQLNAIIPLTDLTAPGKVEVTVFNPAPGGGASNSEAFSVDSNPVPAIAVLNPTSVLLGSGGVSVNVAGSNFLASSVARWNGADRPTKFFSSAQLSVSLSATDVANPGTGQITVFNPSPGGGTSNGATFTINGNPVPVIQSLSPGAAVVGAPDFSLTVTGSGFVSSSVVRWNGQDRHTTLIPGYGLGSQLVAAIGAADVAQLGSAAVTVFTPSPGGGESAPVVFSIVPIPPNPLPVLGSLMPASLPVGYGDFTLTVNGTGFFGGSVVRWNNQDRPTTLAGYNQLRAKISGDDVAAVGTAEVTVFNPPSVNGGGGVSKTADFPVTVNPAPAITSLFPQISAMGAAGVTISVSGTGFVPGSVVRWNGAALPTKFQDSQLQADIPAEQLAQPGTALVTVFNPAPSGGVSNAVVYFVYLPLATNDIVYDPVSKKLYGATPSRAGNNGNSIVSIDPVSGAMGPPVFIGSEPGTLALSDDSSYLYASLMGAASVRQFDMASQTAGPQYPIGLTRAIAVLPGSPLSFAAVSGDVTTQLAVYDSGIRRPATGLLIGIGPLSFGMDAAVLYAADRNNDIYSYSLDSSGISGRQRLNVSGSGLEADGGLIFTNSGQVFDPVANKVIATFNLGGVGVAQVADAFSVDSSLDRAFFLVNGRLMVFRKSTPALLGALDIPGSDMATRLLRWGNDGLAIRAGDQIFLLRIPAVTPTLNAGGVLNAASFATGAAVAPGSLAAVFGSGLAAGVATAAGPAFPTVLGDSLLTMSVPFSAVPVPLFAVSPGQINIQIPWELDQLGAGPTYLTATLSGISSNSISVPLAAAAPGLFSIDQTGGGQGSIVDAQGRVVDASAPTGAGQAIQIYGTGLGRVTNQPASGDPAPSGPLAETVMTPTVTIGGASATVNFSGLAPGFVGLYQINVTVPDSVPTGAAVPVVMNIGGTASNTVTIAVR